MADTEQGRVVQVPESPSASGGLDRYFRIRERGSTVRTEIVAGVTTWLTMAYILFVNPSILGLDGAGLSFPQVLSVTALAAGVMTIAMGLVSNYPFALAAGLGLNAFVAFSLVVGNGLTFPQAMGVIVVEGLVITALVLTNLREMVMNAIPQDLKRAIGIGIGAFITLIGLVTGGVVTNEGPTPLAFGDLTSWPTGVFVVGLVVASVLVARKVKGALLVSILASTILAVIVNEATDGSYWANGIAAVPSDVVATPDLGLIGEFSFGFFSVLGVAGAIAVIVTVGLSDFFDTMGTVIGLGGEAKLLDEQGRLPKAKKVLLVDSLAAVVGGVTSSSSNTTYIESASGISEGGRTGLVAVVVGILFLLSMFLSPIAGVIPPQATGPVLVIVGYFMMTMARDIEWSDPGIGIPALLTVFTMPFTYSITNGVGVGFLSYIVIAVARGRARDIHPALYIVGAIFVWYFVHGTI